MLPQEFFLEIRCPEYSLSVMLPCNTYTMFDDLGHFTVVLANFIATFRLYSDNLLLAIKFAKTTVKCPRSRTSYRCPEIASEAILG